MSDEGNSNPRKSSGGNEKPAESKPAESKPAESKPAESKPVESKPEEQQPVVVIHTLPTKGAPTGGEGDNDTKTVFADSLLTSIAPFKLIMYSLLRFPFTIVRDRKKGRIGFRYVDISVLTVGFAVTSLILLIQFILFIINLWGMLLNFPTARPISNLQVTINRSKQVLQLDALDARGLELYVFIRNLVPVIIILIAFITATVSNVSVFRQRNFACQYLTFLTTAVEQMRVDAAFGLATKMIWFIGLYLLFLILLVIFAVLAFAPITMGTISTFGILQTRIIYRLINSAPFFLHDSFANYRVIGGVTIIYLFINSKTFIILYYWNCKIIRNLFAVWNNRLERVMHRGEVMLTRIEKVANRTGYDHLFKDHGCLLDLIEATDRLFGDIVNSYYGTQVITLCFEFFHAWQSQMSGEEDDVDEEYDTFDKSIKQFPGARRLDGIIMGFFFIHTIIFLILVSTAASSVSHEAMNGLEIIRRKGLLGRKEDEELYFMMSMYVSYTGHFETGLSLGGYTLLNKEFLVVLFGSIISYFIILFQFTPALVIRDPFLLANLKKNDSILQEYVLNKTEWTANPYDNGKTYTAMTISGFAEDFNPTATDHWDFLHSTDFLAFLNQSSNVTSNAF